MSEQTARCELCGMVHDPKTSKHVKIKGKIKTVCEGCAAETKGFS